MPAAFVWGAPQDKTDIYIANGLNQYDTINNQIMGYDDNGSLISDGVWTYGYDVENRLETASKTGVSANYEYDPLGRRSRKSGAGVSTEVYLNDGVEEIADYDGSNNLLRRYVHGLGVDERLVMYTGTSLSSKEYYHTDHQGSSVAMSSNSGVLTDQYTYSVFGEPGAEGLTGNPFRYTGRRLDAETGLYYYRARFYSPSIGRFLQTDPIGYGDNMNMYAYVGNDPVNAVDPSGLDSYHVTRPTEIPGGNHSFILVTNVDPNGIHTIREMFSFGAENASAPLGRMQRITDPNRAVFATDAAAATSIVNNLNNPPGTVPANVTSVVSIPAPDDLTVDVANSVTGSPDYDLIPDLFPGNGVNSNTAPAFIATTSAELAGNDFQVPDPDGLQPGTDQNHIDQVEHTTLPPRLRNRY